MYWIHLKARQISDLSHQTPVLVPTAAVEQHGPHLPVGTDTIIANALCERIESCMPNEVIIAPTLSVGCSAHHVRFGGTLSLTHGSYQALVEEVIGSVAGCGLTNIVLLNAHGGNAASNLTACERIAYRNDSVNLFSTNWWTVAHGELSALSETGPGGVGHAGEFETSIMLAVAPDLVESHDRVSRDGPGNDPAWCAGDMLRGASVSYVRPFHRISDSGVVGEPAAASAVKGEQLLSVIVERMELVLRDIATGAL